MPELPEVETMVRDLRGPLLGAIVLDAWSVRPQMLNVDLGLLRAEVAGSRIMATERRAKTVLLRLDSGRVLTFAPRMTGLFWLGPAGAPRHRHDRFGLSLANGQELRFRDLRTFGRIGLYTTDSDGMLLNAAGEPLFADLGPEPLGPDFELANFVARLGARKRARARLKPLLLDQSFLAGLGNIYADECLWRARIHPLRQVDSLRVEEIAQLYMTIRAVLAEAIERRGSAVSDYAPPDGRASMQHHLAVYGRTGRPCLHCGTPIERIVIAGRSSHFCPVCQLAPPPRESQALVPDVPLLAAPADPSNRLAGSD